MCTRGLGESVKKPLHSFQLGVLGILVAGCLVGTAAGQGGWTAGVTNRPRQSMATAVLREVRVGRHRGFGRVVWEFRGGGVPGYRIEYIDRPVRQCGSGHAVSLAGQGRLAVQLVPAQAHDNAGRATLESRERAPRFRTLRELKQTCDFEADATWVLGVASPHRYRVFDLAQSARLVVDIRH